MSLELFEQEHKNEITARIRDKTDYSLMGLSFPLFTNYQDTVTTVHKSNDRFNLYNVIDL